MLSHVCHRVADVLAQVHEVLALAAIDHFSDVNETAGQAVRAQLLHGIAVIIEYEMPEQHLISRIGNATFAILLPRTRPGRGTTDQ